MMKFKAENYNDVDFYIDSRWCRRKSIEIITGVAIVQYADVWMLPSPYRHHNVIRQMYENGTELHESHVQGFVTSAGRFCTRELAREIAIKSGQIKDYDRLHATQLFSEDVW